MNQTLLAWMTGVVLIATGCTRLSREEVPQIYDTRADGEQQLAATLAEAKRTNKRVLLDLGANWCSDSQAMFRLFNTNAEVARVIEENYVFEMIDVNQRGLGARNARLVERLGNPLSQGIPVLLILDANGAVLNSDPSERLADSDHQHPAMVLAYLRKWATPR
jgi:thiol-disulfide isomerase/thioredoxin